MKKSGLILLFLAFLAVSGVKAQIVSGSLFLQGRFLEIGSQPNGSLGSSTSSPSGYHATGYTSGTGTSISLCGASRSLAMVYDWGKDGWTSGTPLYMGDYTLPGSPWEGWAMAASTSDAFAYSTSCGFTGTMSGTHTSYTNTGGRAIGTWDGTAFSGASLLSVHKEHRIDTNSSALVVTVTFKNNTSSPIPGVYYLRSCDPDQSVPWGGSFTTVNTINFQNDYYHRVLVSATASGAASATGTPPAPIGIGTKDCRCKAVIYRSWPLSTSVRLADLWAGTASVGGAFYTLGNTTTGDIAIGLVCNVGTIPANDSSLISYAYIFNGANGIDSAFPEPQMALLGSVYDSFASVCATMDSFNVDLLNATDKAWSWSDWTWAPSTGLSSTTGVSNTVNVRALSGPTTYTITGVGTRTGNCADKIFTLLVYPGLPDPPTVSDVYYCEGVPASPLTASGVSLLWYTTATGGTGSTTPPTPSTAAEGVYTYYVTQSPCPGNESPRAAIRVYVTPRPTVTAANDGPHCANSTLRLFAYDTVTIGTKVYSWTGPGGFASSSQFPVIGSTVAADSGVYSVVLTVNGCVSRPASTLAIVHFTPSAPAVTNVTYCQYATAVPLIATGSGVLWYSSATGGTPSATPPTPSTSTPGIFRFYATQTVNDCESPRGELTVTILPEPAPPVVTVQSYCQFDVAVPAEATGTSLLWYGMGLSGTSTAPTPNTDVPMTYTYYVTQTVLGCVSDSAIDTIVIRPQPAPPRPVDTSLCQFSEPTRLLAAGTFLAWYPTPTGGVRIDSTPNPPTTVVGSTTYYVTQTVDGCTSPRAPLTYTILPRPTFELNPDREWVCQSDTFTLAYSGGSLFDSVYKWTLPVGARFTDGTTEGDSIVHIIFDSLTFQNVALTVTSFRRCSFSDTFSVRVISEPGGNFYLSQNICAGDTITLALRSRTLNAARFAWVFDGADIVTASSSSGGPYSVRWLTPGLKVVTMRPYTLEGCLGDLRTDTVRVRAVPDARIFNPGGVSGVICLEDSLLLKAITEVDGYRYWWTPERFFNQNNRARIWGQIVTSGFVRLHVSDAYGCSASDSVLISPDACCTVTFPSAFTPNNDGRNDHFRPIFKGYHRFQSFRIVNRWGQTVFETVNTESEWDGTFGGVPQDMGVYYYFIKFDCGDSKDKLEKGEVTLIR
jgi:gliding motility-associated-like protein